MTAHGESENSVQTGFNKTPYMLRCTAVYGPNASGKSNLIQALQYMNSFVEEGYTKYKPGESIKLNNFILSKKSPEEKSYFDITFIHKERLYNYGFILDSKRVHQEWLYYIQKDGSKKQTKKAILERQYNEDIGSYIYSPTSLKKKWRDVRDNALSLSTAAYDNEPEAMAVYEWFSEYLRVAEANSIHPITTIELLGLSELQIKIKDLIKLADLGIQDFEEIEKKEIDHTFINLLEKMEAPEEIRLRFKNMETRSMIFKHFSKDGDNNVLPFDEQSTGTKLMFGLAGPLIHVLENGYILIIDELERSLHPHLVEEIIKIFQSSETNKKNAQLIFTAHNTYFMNFLNRDQIWFTEKSEHGESQLIPLLDYMPRTTDTIEKYYNQGRYRAVPHITGLYKK